MTVGTAAPCGQASGWRDTLAGRLAAGCRERGRFGESGRSADGGREVSSAIVRRAFVQNGSDANCAGRAIAAVADHRRGTVTADYSGRPRSISMVYAYAFRTSEFACKLPSDVFGAAGRLFPLQPSGRRAEFLAAQASEGVGALPSRCSHRSLGAGCPATDELTEPESGHFNLATTIKSDDHTHYVNSNAIDESRDRNARKRKYRRLDSTLDLTDLPMRLQPACTIFRLACVLCEHRPRIPEEKSGAGSIAPHGGKPLAPTQATDRRDVMPPSTVTIVPLV